MTEFHPFRTSPFATDLSCWRWTEDQTQGPNHYLADQNGQRLAAITVQEGSFWQAEAINEGHQWVRDLDYEPPTNPAPYFQTPWRSHDLTDLKRAVERDLSFAAILYGAAPDPVNVPAIFILGHQVDSDTFLKIVEGERRVRRDDHDEGSLATLPGDPEEQLPPNAALQARFLAAAFQMTKAESSIDQANGILLEMMTDHAAAAAQNIA